MGGFVLATSLLMLAVITVLVTNGLGTVVMEEKMSSNQRLLVKSRIAAEHGISNAIEELLKMSVNDPGAAADPAWSSSGYGTESDSASSYRITHRVIGEIIATNVDGIPFYRIVSEGSNGAAFTSIEATVAMDYRNIWDAAFSGCDGIDIYGTGAIRVYRFSGKPVAGKGADVFAIGKEGNVNLKGFSVINGNIRSTGLVTLNDQTTVTGDVAANRSVSISNGSTVLSDVFAGEAVSDPFNRVQGRIHQNQEIRIVAPVTCDPLNVDELFLAEAKPLIDKNENSKLTTAYFDGRDYHVTGNAADIIGSDEKSTSFTIENFSTDSQAAIEIRGDTTLYIRKNFSLHDKSSVTLAPGSRLTIFIDGGFVMDSHALLNPGGNPGLLRIYSSAANNNNLNPEKALVRVTSNAAFHGILYAPRSLIDLSSDGDSRGALSGRWINFDSDATFWYDADLLEYLSPYPAGYHLVEWHE